MLLTQYSVCKLFPGVCLYGRGGVSERLQSILITGNRWWTYSGTSLLYKKESSDYYNEFSLYWIKKFWLLSFSDLVDILYDRRLLKDWTLFIIGACSGSFKFKKKNWDYHFLARLGNVPFNILPVWSFQSYFFNSLSFSGTM